MTSINQISAGKLGFYMALQFLLKILYHPKYSTKWRIVFWLNAALLLYLTLMPSVNYRLSIDNIDKVFHLVGFGAFALFLGLAYPRLQLWKVFFISSLLGILVELIQSQIPYRSFSFADMLADWLGILIAIVFLKISKPTKE
ncbi:MAG: VanZ family protein [Enterobacterales bacterium]|nr:VanZ family protein [Enterobacterales bacterium]